MQPRVPKIEEILGEGHADDSLCHGCDVYALLASASVQLQKLWTIGVPLTTGGLGGTGGGGVP